MAKPVVPLKKQSKRAQREYHARQRTGWNGLNPVTRRAPDRTLYSRQRRKQEDRAAAAEA